MFTNIFLPLLCFEKKAGVFIPGKLFRLSITLPEAVFLVVCDPSMNEL
jgi:hypothetical protein